VADLLIIALAIELPTPRGAGQDSNLHTMIPSEVTVTCTPGAMKLLAPEITQCLAGVSISKRSTGRAAHRVPTQRSTSTTGRAPGL
jgi:hypothetical protein